MEHVHSEFIRADKLLQNYNVKEKKFQKRFETLNEEMLFFIDEMGLKNRVELNALALGYALVDYFEDIHRLKDFHKVKHINGIKIVSYTAFWLLKRKPIQIIGCDKELLDVNERFVLQYILTFLSSDDKEHVLVRENAGLTSFSETLLYYLKYRLTTANNLEMIIMAFFAGQIYQETSRDLSQILGKMNEE